MTIKELCGRSCTGCLACVEKCGLGAISVRYNTEGFPYPDINDSLCADCGQCSKVCPVLSEGYMFNKTIEGFLCCGKDQKLTFLSASGGAFSVFADYYITKLNGIVFGACMDGDFIVRHHGSASDISKMQGSKYVQSHTNGCFECAKKYLDAGRHVLFSGTPCQIAGLKNYLRQDYERLRTVDIVCHGVASPKLFIQYIRHLESKYQRKIASYRFRNKTKYDAGGFVSKIVFDHPSGRSYGKPEKLIHAQRDVFFSAYLKGLIFRESCYECRFACRDRVSDLTLGDCNTAGDYPEFHPGEAKSIVLCNTPHGKSLFESLKNEFDGCNLNLEKEQRVNKQLNAPSHRPAERESTLKMFACGEFDRKRLPALRLTPKQKIKTRIQMILPWKFRSSVGTKLKQFMKKQTK